MANGNYEEPVTMQPATELQQLQSENQYLHKELDELIRTNKELESKLMDINERINAAKYILTMK